MKTTAEKLSSFWLSILKISCPDVFEKQDRFCQQCGKRWSARDIDILDAEKKWCNECIVGYDKFLTVAN